jgi:hypothetical protein
MLTDYQKILHPWIGRYLAQTPKDILAAFLADPMNDGCAVSIHSKEVPRDLRELVTKESNGEIIVFDMPK